MLTFLCYNNTKQTGFIQLTFLTELYTQVKEVKVNLHERCSVMSGKEKCFNYY